MAYVNPNCKSKAELKRRLAAGESVSVFQAGLGDVPRDGSISLEGPHYPKPHTWYGQGTMKDGKLISVK